MKNFLLIIATVLATSISFGQAGAATAATVILPETLEHTMDAMGDSLKAVATNFANPNLKDATVTASANLVVLAVHAQTLVPDTIQALPPEVQPAATAKYNSMLSQVSVVAVKIVSALQSGKTDLVPGLINDLKALKKDGHTEFKKD